GVHQVSGSLDEDAPSLARARAELVDLERHLGLGMLDPGAQILSQRAVLPGPEHDRPFMQRIVDRQDRGPEPARVTDPANATGRVQPLALRLIQELKDRLRALQRCVVACHAVLLPREVHYANCRLTCGQSRMRPPDGQKGAGLLPPGSARVTG